MNTTPALFLIFILFTFGDSRQFSDDILQRLEDVEIKLRDYGELIQQQQLLIQSQQRAIFQLENIQRLTDSETKQDQETAYEGSFVNKTAGKVRSELLNDNSHKRQLAIQDHPKIAFSAYLDHSTALGSYQTIMFNKVITNDGGAYNAHSGVFTSPVTGLYLFSFQISSRNTDQVWAHLVVNDNFKVDGVADGYHTNQDAQGGNTVVLNLKAGDNVWIKAFHGGNFNIEYHSGHFNVFTGVLLYN